MKMMSRTNMTSMNGVTLIIVQLEVTAAFANCNHGAYSAACSVPSRSRLTGKSDPAEASASSDR